MRHDLTTELFDDVGRGAATVFQVEDHVIHADRLQDTEQIDEMVAILDRSFGEVLAEVLI